MSGILAKQWWHASQKASQLNPEPARLTKATSKLFDSRAAREAPGVEQSGQRQASSTVSVKSFVETAVNVSGERVSITSEASRTSVLVQNPGKRSGQIVLGAPRPYDGANWIPR